MLADHFDIQRELLKSVPAEQHAWLSDGVNAVGEIVKDAHRFTLDRGATMMVENIAHQKMSSFTKAIGICRLPATTMWIEFPFKDRADWLVEAVANGFEISENPTSSAPIHLGFLLTEINVADGRFLTIQPAWNHHPNQVEVSRQIVVIDLNPVHVHKGASKYYRDECLADREKMKAEGYTDVVEFEAFVELMERVQYITPNFMQSYWDEAARQGPALDVGC